MLVRVHRIIKKTNVEGPGKRFCIWFQGCKKNCKGCFMPAAQSDNGGFLIDTDAVFKQILVVKEKIEGVTFLGGEPFEQPEALLCLAEQIKAIGLTVLVFTGFQYSDLLSSKNDAVLNSLSHIDLLIDGDFQIDKLDYSRPWVGSANQNYLFLTDAYNWETVKNMKNKFELHLSENGELRLNGMGNLNLLKNLL